MSTTTLQDEHVGQRDPFRVVDGIQARGFGDYWDGRAVGYSAGVRKELKSGHYADWVDVLARSSSDARKRAVDAGRVPRALDLGCGPGFFSIILARLGCRVEAVDSSASMLDEARANNLVAGTGECVGLHESDVEALPFEDGSFDLVVSRNVTWLLRDPEAAYVEWGRVLAPGGKLVVFDANWYRYLVNPVIDAQRIIDEESADFPRLDVNGNASSDQESRCERIALSLPLTSVLRPEWDISILRDLGYRDVCADEQIWKRVWNDEEASFYGTSPLFLVEATK